MITASITRASSGQVFSFKVSNHGESYVCAAVSMLVINTINGIEALTEADFSYDCDEKKGSITFSLLTPRGEPSGRDAGILLDAMVLGLQSAAAAHPEDLTIKEYNESE